MRVKILRVVSYISVMDEETRAIYLERVGWITAKRLFKIGVPQISEYYWEIDNDYEEIMPDEFKENPDWCDGKIRPKSRYNLDKNGIPTAIGKGLYAAFTDEELAFALGEMQPSKK